MYMHVHVYYMHVQQMTVKVHTNGHTQLQGDEECNLDKQHVYITQYKIHTLYMYFYTLYTYMYRGTCTLTPSTHDIQK